MIKKGLKMVFDSVRLAVRNLVLFLAWVVVIYLFGQTIRATNRLSDPVYVILGAVLFLSTLFLTILHIRQEKEEWII